jgi:hypothetical protein
MCAVFACFADVMKPVYVMPTMRSMCWWLSVPQLHTIGAYSFTLLRFSFDLPPYLLLKLGKISATANYRQDRYFQSRALPVLWEHMGCIFRLKSKLSKKPAKTR